MNESRIATEQSPEPATMTGLEEAHARLLERRHLVGDGSNTLLDEARYLIEWGRHLGRIVEEPHARVGCQSILNYWAVYIYRVTQQQVDPHLVPYDAETAPVLSCPCPYRFGGDGQSPLELSAGWQRLIDESIKSMLQAGMVTVTGTAGSGRRLFVDRVLLPWLKNGGDSQLCQTEQNGRWRYVDVTTDDRPVSRLVAGVASLSDDKSTASSLERSIHRNAENFVALLGNDSDGVKTKTMLVVRNLERALRQPAQERDAFFGALFAAVREPHSPCTILATLRREGIVRLSWLGPLELLFRQTQLPLTFTSNELRSFIEDPAERVGLIFDPGVVDRIINDLLGEPTALPLLKFTMARLWGRRVRNRITRGVYNAAGAGRVALEMEADAVARDLADDIDTLRKVLLVLVQFEVGGVVSVRVASRSELAQNVTCADSLDRVLSRLEASDLIECDSCDGVQTYEIKYYAILTCWPLLIEWLDQWRADHRLQLELSAAAQRFVAGGRSPDLLWRGAAIRDARERLDRNKLLILEREFLDESHRREQMVRFVRRATVAVLVGMLILLVTTGVAIEIGRSNREKTATQIQLWNSILPDLQDRLQKNDPAAASLLLDQRDELAKQIGVQVSVGSNAKRTSLGNGPDADCWRRGIAQMQLPHLNWIWLVPTEGGWQFQSLHPTADGTQVLALQTDTDLKHSRVWMLKMQPNAEPQPIVVRQDSDVPVRDIALASIGGIEWILAADENGMLIAKREADKELKFDALSSEHGESAGFGRIFVGPSGQIATLRRARTDSQIDEPGQLGIWQIEHTGESSGFMRLRSVPLVEDGPAGNQDPAAIDFLRRVKFARISPSGRWLLIVHREPDASRDAFRIWDFSAHAYLGATEQNGVAMNWKPLRTESKPSLDWVHGQEIRSVAFAPASVSGAPELSFATGSASGAVDLWGIAQNSETKSATIGPRPSSPILHEGDVYDLSFENGYLITASRDRTLRTWYPSTGLEATQPLFHEGTLAAAAVVRPPQRMGQLLSLTEGAMRSWSVGRFAGSLELVNVGDPSLAVRATKKTAAVRVDGSVREIPLYRQLDVNRRVDYIRLDESGRYLFLAVAPRSDDNAKKHEMIVLDSLSLRSATGSKWAISPFNARPTAVAFAPDCKSLALARDQRVVRWKIHEAATADFKFEKDTPRPSAVNSLTFSTDGSQLFAGGRVANEDKTNGLIWGCRFNDSDDCVFKAPAELMPDSTFPEGVLSTGVRMFNRQEFFFTGEEFNRAQIFKMPFEKCAVAAFRHTSDVGIVASGSSSEGSVIRLVTVSSDGEFKLWNFDPKSTGSTPHRVLSHGGKVDCAIFSPDGDLVITAGQDGLLRLWHFQSAEPVGTMRLGGAVADMRFVDNRVLLTVGRRDLSEGSEGALALRMWQIAPIQNFEADDAQREVLASRQLDRKLSVMSPLVVQELRERLGHPTVDNEAGQIFQLVDGVGKTARDLRSSRNARGTPTVVRPRMPADSDATSGSR